MRQVISTAAEAATKTLPAGDVSLGCGQLRASHIRELNPEVQRTSFISSTICKIPGSPDRPDFSAFAFSAACPTASHMRILHRRGVEPQGRGLGPGSQFTWHIHSVCVCVCACVCVCKLAWSQGCRIMPAVHSAQQIYLYLTTLYISNIYKCP